MAYPALARPSGAATLLTTLVTSVILVTTACGSDPADTGRSEAGGSASDFDASGGLEELAAGDLYPAIMDAMQEAGTAAFAITSVLGGRGVQDTTEMSGVAEYAEAGVSFRSSGTSYDAQQLEVIALDGATYFGGPAMEGMADKPWVKADMSDPNGVGALLGRVTDPMFVFRGLEEPAEVALLGTEEIDGVQTNHYRVALDPDDYAEALGVSPELAPSTSDQLEVEVWLDADDRPHRYSQEVTLPQSSGGEALDSTFEGTFSDFGAEVQIEAPPAEEVAEGVL